VVSVTDPYDHILGFLDNLNQHYKWLGDMRHSTVEGSIIVFYWRRCCWVHCLLMRFTFAFLQLSTSATKTKTFAAKLIEWFAAIVTSRVLQFDHQDGRSSDHDTNPCNVPSHGHSLTKQSRQHILQSDKTLDH
jgi:hypothetical protein